MGSGRTRWRIPEGAGAHAAGPVRRPEHPLLPLQQLAGNKAMTQLLQRDRVAPNPRTGRSNVANATLHSLYENRCDAKFDGPAVRRRTESRGHDARLIIFDCGPQRFRFEASGADEEKRGPWYFLQRDDDVAWVLSPVERALDRLYNDFDSVNATWWDAYHVIKDGLQQDIETYCAP